MFVVEWITFDHGTKNNGIFQNTLFATVDAAAEHLLKTFKEAKPSTEIPNAYFYRLNDSYCTLFIVKELWYPEQAPRVTVTFKC